MFCSTTLPQVSIHCQYGKDQTKYGANIGTVLINTIENLSFRQLYLQGRAKP